MIELVAKPNEWFQVNFDPSTFNPVEYFGGDITLTEISVEIVGIGKLCLAVRRDTIVEYFWNNRSQFVTATQKNITLDLVLSEVGVFKNNRDLCAIELVPEIYFTNPIFFDEEIAQTTSFHVDTGKFVCRSAYFDPDFGDESYRANLGAGYYEMVNSDGYVGLDHFLLFYDPQDIQSLNDSKFMLVTPDS